MENKFVYFEEWLADHPDLDLQTAVEAYKGYGREAEKFLEEYEQHLRSMRK